MKTSAKILLFVMPGLAGAVAVLSAMTLTKSNIKANPFPAHLETPDGRPGSAPAAAVTACRQGQAIVAAGLVEPPGGMIKIGAPTSGIVSRVLVRPGMAIRMGEPLFELDSRTARAVLAVRNSELAIVHAQLAARLSEAREAKADVARAEAVLDEQHAGLADALQLSAMADRLKSSAHISKRERLRRHFQVKQSRAKVLQAKASLAKAREQLRTYSSAEGGWRVSQEQANLAKAEALVAAAKSDLDQLTVRAPRGGIVYQVNVRPGELAGRDDAAHILFGSGSQLHVKVDVYEADFQRFDARMLALAARRAPGAAKHTLLFAHVLPIVVPKRQLSGRLDEREDARVFQAVYRLTKGALVPGEVVDVFLRTGCEVAANAAAEPVRTRQE